VSVLVSDQIVGPREGILKERVAAANAEVTDASRTCGAINDDPIVVKTADSRLLCAESVVESDDLLRAAGWRHVDGVGVCRHVHRQAEVVGRVGSVRDRGRGAVGATIARVNCARGIKAHKAGEACERGLRCVREPQDGVDIIR
jgi:hypothetical protein